MPLVQSTKFNEVTEIQVNGEVIATVRLGGNLHHAKLIWDCKSPARVHRRGMNEDELQHLYKRRNASQSAGPRRDFLDLTINQPASEGLPEVQHTSGPGDAE